VLNALSGIREIEIVAFSGRALLRGKVGNEHIRLAAKNSGNLLGGSSVCTTANLDGCAVHVHFAVANFVEPSPRKSVLARREIAWEGDRIRIDLLVILTILWIVAKVAPSIRRTASNNGMEDLPLTLLRGCFICGYAKLARATAMDSGILYEFDLLGLAGVPLVLHRGASVVFGTGGLAREIGAAGVQRGFVRKDKWFWVFHLHVRGSAGGERQDRCGELHGEYLVDTKGVW
jgi:hypothetical protein